MKTVAIIPARAGSMGIPGKNIKVLGGKPLIAWTIQAAIYSGAFDGVFVSSESSKIGDIASSYGANWLWRPTELATSSVQTDEVVLFALHQLGDVEYDTAVLLQPTSPFRTGDDIKGAVGMYDSIRNGTVLSAYKDTKYHWRAEKGQTVFEPLYHNPEKRLGRQWEIDSNIWTENGAIYVFGVKRFLRERCYRLSPYYIYEMPEIKSSDLDTMDDWYYAEWLLEKGLV